MEVVIVLGLIGLGILVLNHMDPPPSKPSMATA